MQLTDDVREYLSKRDEEFKKFYEKHKMYENELKELTSKSNLTPEEEIKISEIKKMKLNVKDKMMIIAKKYEQELKNLRSGE